MKQPTAKASASSQGLPDEEGVVRPPVEIPPVEIPPVENPHVENPPVENPPVENPPVEIPPAPQACGEYVQGANCGVGACNIFKRKLLLRNFANLNRFNIEILNMAEKEEEKKDEIDEKKKKLEEDIDPYAFMKLSTKTEGERLAIAEEERTKGDQASSRESYAEAEKYYSRSIAASPTIASLNSRAFAYFQMKNYAASLLDTNAVLNLNKCNATALYRRGMVLVKMQKYKEAYLDFFSALEFEPNNVEAQEMLIYTGRIPNFTKMLDLQPKDVIQLVGQLKERHVVRITRKKPPPKIDSCESTSPALENSKEPNSDPSKEEDEMEKGNREKISRGEHLQSIFRAERGHSSDMVTPYRFMTWWYVDGAATNSDAGASILKKFPPELLPNLLGTRLDGDLLCSIVRAITKIASSDISKSFKLMASLSKTERLQTVLSFLSSDEREDIENLFSLFKESEMEGIPELERKFLAT